MSHFVASNRRWIFGALLIALAGVFFFATSNPLDAGAAPPVLEVLNDGTGQWQLRWKTNPGFQYELQQSENLCDWTVAAGSPYEATGEMLAIDLLPAGQRGFYRVLDLGPIKLDREVEVYFSVPGPTGAEEDLTLEEKVKELLALAKPGSEVLAAVYTWSRTTMADAFIEAYQRGVDVRLIIGSDYPAVTKLQQSLRSGRVLVCRDAEGTPNGCHGGRINHNKFFLFSELADGSRDVVVQSSANLTFTQIRFANNMVIIRNDTGLYNDYHMYWNDLYRERDDLDYYREGEDDGFVQAYFFPRSEGNGSTGENDTVVEILDELGVGPEGQIHVAMAFWSNARVAIANRLAALDSAGTEVRVILNAEEAGANVVAALVGGGVEVIHFPFVHSKYLLVDHGIGRLRERLVFTGSHNYTSPALRSNDEVLLRLRDDAVYDAFSADWEAMSDHPRAGLLSQRILEASATRLSRQ